MAFVGRLHRLCYPPLMRRKLRGFWLFTPVGLPPTEHVYLSWTHCLAKRSYTSEINDLAQSSIRSFPLKFFAMMLSLRHFLGWLVSSFSCRADLVLENLALSRQLLALHAQRPRRRWTALHKLFWVALRMCWSRWRQPLVLVTPRTVVNWHRAGFRLYWTWVSRIRQVGGRKRVSKEVRALIFRMVAENPTWGAPRIHGELLKLGFDLSQRSVSRWILPSPEKPGPDEAMAAVPQQPSRVYCCDGLFHRPNAHFWCSVLLFRHRPRPA